MRLHRERELVATNITDLKFDDGQQVNVVVYDDNQVGGTYTYVASALDFQEHGVMVEATNVQSGNTFRTFIAYHRINRIYQQI